MTVLLISRTDDHHCTDRVVRAIEARGGDALRVDTDLFPTEVGLSVSTDANGHDVVIETRDRRVPLCEVRAVWHRRLFVAGGLPDDMDRDHRRVSTEESRRTFMGMLESLPVFRLDPEFLVRRAEHKSAQLTWAREVGMDIPRTLTTNEPDAVRAFAATCPGGIITKMLSAFALYDAEGRENVVFTSEVSTEDLADLDGLRLCPMTFQERVPKAVELRVTVMGYDVFAAAVDSQANVDARVDWRRDGVGLLHAWVRHDLPPLVRHQVLAFMDRVGLNYGALDFILTPDGRYVFLEINPVGEFFWLEDCPGFPLSDTLAALLLGQAPRRRAHFIL